ncbi:MAG: restriction endonuclease [Clostridiales bacterium]|nr:restriction endonuclease [Clostridiales bacterium]
MLILTAFSKLILCILALCADIVSVPFCIVAVFFCKLFKQPAPRIKRKGLLVYPSWKRRTTSGPLSGLEYEHYCERWLIRSKKYRQVKVTPASGDFGADITAIDKKGRKWVFQCKRYSSKLGNKPIQEVVAAKSHYNASCAAVITNSSFTDNARQLAKENNVVLYEHIG